MYNIKDRLWLNHLLHPIICLCIKKDLKLSKSIYTIIEIPLLNNNNIIYYNYIKKIILVCASLENKINRIIIRDNMSIKESNIIIKTQVDDEKRYKLSNYLINNNDNIASLIKNVKKVHKKIMLECSTEN